MTVEFYSIGEDVYFINDEQKVVCGHITEIEYNAKKNPNSDGYSSLLKETIVYTIDHKYRRQERFVFKSRNKLIDNL